MFLLYNISSSRFTEGNIYFKETSLTPAAAQSTLLRGSGEEVRIKGEEVRKKKKRKENLMGEGGREPNPSHQIL